jgi:hypothetical protein
VRVTGAAGAAAVSALDFGLPKCLDNGTCLEDLERVANESPPVDLLMAALVGGVVAALLVVRVVAERRALRAAVVLSALSATAAALCVLPERRPTYHPLFVVPLEFYVTAALVGFLVGLWGILLVLAARGWFRQE